MRYTKMSQISRLTYILPIILLFPLLFAACPGKVITKLGGTPIPVGIFQFSDPDSQGRVKVVDTETGQGAVLTCRELLNFLRENERAARGAGFTDKANQIRALITSFEQKCRAVDAPID